MSGVVLGIAIGLALWVLILIGINRKGFVINFAYTGLGKRTAYLFNDHAYPMVYYRFLFFQLIGFDARVLMLIKAAADSGMDADAFLIKNAPRVTAYKEELERQIHQQAQEEVAATLEDYKGRYERMKQDRDAERARTSSFYAVAQKLATLAERQDELKALLRDHDERMAQTKR